MTKKQARIVLKFSKAENILLNLAGGLKIKNLTVREKKILEKEYGINWLEKINGNS